ncbi:hypothetical protein [Nonomuraea sp. NPDC049784]|uniref:hypothetical protein n=1 Tax=Nonomuraea sp. NPDC049784 TaxID=3154361 RepID=UPI003400D6CC
MTLENAEPVRDEQDEEGRDHRQAHLTDGRPAVAAHGHPEGHADGHVGGHEQGLDVDTGDLGQCRVPQHAEQQHAEAHRDDHLDVVPDETADLADLAARACLVNGHRGLLREQEEIGRWSAPG